MSIFQNKKILGMALAVMVIIHIASVAYGQTRVIDGDSLDINGIKVRLYGIDAPELKQVCQNSEGKFYACGLEARKALQVLILDGILCDMKGLDIFKRVLAVCYAGEININSMMVLTGNAVAYRKYSEEYVLQEEIAKQKKQGIWQGEFTMPWNHRKNRKKQ